MVKRWFSDEELEEMSRPTMDRADIPPRHWDRYGLAPSDRDVDAG